MEIDLTAAERTVPKALVLNSTAAKRAALRLYPMAGVRLERGEQVFAHNERPMFAPAL